MCSYTSNTKTATVSPRVILVDISVAVIQATVSVEIMQLEVSAAFMEMKGCSKYVGDNT